MTQGFNNLDFNNIYRNWLQGQIETANARGLIGGQTPNQIINQDLVRPIDNIIKQARLDMRNPNRGIMVGNQNLVGRGPTSTSVPKQLPAVTTSSNIVNPNARIPKVQPRVNTPNVINMYPSNDIKLLTYDPSKKIVDPSLGKQISYRLPNGNYTSNPELVNIANRQIAKAKLLRGAKAGGITSVISIPGAILAHKDAYKYYDDMAKNESLPGEWRQIANAMKLKEAAAMGVEGPGTALGTALGSRFGKIGTAIGGIAPGLLGQTIGAGIDFLSRDAIEKYNFPVYKGKQHNIGSILNNNSNVVRNNTSGITRTNGNTNNNIGRVNTPQTTQQQALTLAQQLGNNTPASTQQAVDNQQGNVDAINDYVSKLQNVNQPYIDALQKFSSNYDDLVRRNFNAQRYFTAMAGLSGNQGYTRLADALNPINNEINKLNTLKTLRDAQAGDINAINEVMGNLAMAQEMGLPPEAAFANKNLLTMMAAKEREANRYQIALENNLMKKYGIDRNYARALTVQAMRGQNALDVANIYTGAYTGGAAPGLNRQGGVQTTYRPLANKQQSQEASLFQQVTGH